MNNFIKELYCATSQTGWVIFDKVSTGIFLGIGFGLGAEIYKVLTGVFNK